MIRNRGSFQFNISINPEKPEELKYDINCIENFEKCRGIKNTAPDNNISDQNTFEEVYSKSNLIDLPNKYSYDFINEEKGFIQLPKEFYKKFNIEESDNYKIAKLPAYNDLKPVLLIVYDITGQSKLYLVTLSNTYDYLDKIKLYDSKESEQGSLSTIYEIGTTYDVIVKNVLIKDISNKVVENTIKKNQYIIDNNGKFVEKK